MDVPNNTNIKGLITGKEYQIIEKIKEPTLFSTVYKGSCKDEFIGNYPLTTSRVLDII